MMTSNRKILQAITPRSLYNCGGYALNTYSWYLPADWGYDYFFNSKKENEEKIEELSNNMLYDFPDMRRIEKIEELQDDEYAIAFRITKFDYQDDFHFLKRGKNGVWYEKRGKAPQITPFPASQVFAESWHDRYVGKIALFAKKCPKIA